MSLTIKSKRKFIIVGLKVILSHVIRSNVNNDFIFQQQQSKPVIMTNPAISAITNDLKNSAQQYQQQQQAAGISAHAKLAYLS